jgi:hypothetical protein
MLKSMETEVECMQEHFRPLEDSRSTINCPIIPCGDVLGTCPGARSPLT